MTDDLDLTIPADVVRRLEGIDAALDAWSRQRQRADNLDRTRPSDLAVVPGRVGRRSARPQPLGAVRARPVWLAASLAITVGAVVVLGYLGASSPLPTASNAVVGTVSPIGVVPTPVSSASADASATAPSSPAASASTSASSAPIAKAAVIRVAGPAFTILQKELRSTCLGKSVVPGESPDKATILQAAALRRSPGWLDAAQTVWFGKDPAEAAAAFGGRTLVVGQDGSWVVIGLPPKAQARQLDLLVTDTGIAYWLGLEALTGTCP